MSWMNSNGPKRSSLRDIISWMGGNYKSEDCPGEKLTEAELQEPLQFHQVHGTSIQRCYDNTVARRTSSYCNGVTFTHRPVKVLEKVYINIFDVDTMWDGDLRIGFTTQSPVKLEDEVPPFAVPNLSEKDGCVAERVFEDLIDERSVIFFYFDEGGRVHYGMNGVEEGIFKPKVEVRPYQYAVIDVYGNTKGVQLVDSDYHYNMPRGLSLMTYKNLPGVFRSKECKNCYAAFKAMKFKQEAYYPLAFSAVAGKNVILSSDRLIAANNGSGDECHLISKRPWVAHECMVIKVLKKDNLREDLISIGVASSDPMHSKANIVPNHDETRLDENLDTFWDEVMKDAYLLKVGVIDQLKVGDVLLLWIDCKGELLVKINDGNPKTLKDVNSSKILWMYLNLSGSISSIRAFTNVKLVGC